MKKAAKALLAAAMVVLLPGATPASASFGLHGLDVSFTSPDGTPVTQAGSHPFAMRTDLALNTRMDATLGFEIPDGEAKDLQIDLPPGFVGNPGATPRCLTADFATQIPVNDNPAVPGGYFITACPDSTAVGVAAVKVGLQGPPGPFHSPVFNLVPPPGAVAKLGFWAYTVPVVVEIGVNEAPPYNVRASLQNIPQPLRFYESQVTLWGNPASSAHDDFRGSCVPIPGSAKALEEIPSVGTCPTDMPERPFITLPRSCQGPLATTFAANSWQDPGNWFSGSVLTDDGSGGPQGMTGCGKLGFGPRIDAQPTNRSAESPTGLDFNLDITDEGLTNASGIAQSDVKKAVVTLPEGVTINPSQAEGLAVCSEEDLRRERSDSEPGEGCPEASKVGTVEVETPLLEGEILKGSLFVGEPYENRFGTLIALYMTIKSRELGINVVLAGKVEPDPRTGQLITTFDDLPQLPFSHFRLHFREGGRSPLVTPPTCGTYETEAVFTPWASPATTYATTSTFETTSGVGGGPCPKGGDLPFAPGFTAGSTNNNAGSYSPFYMRFTRRDGDQDLTRLSSTLPPGMVAKLAGTSACSDAAIAAAMTKTGREELASPSCPSSAEIGDVLAGAGVGPELTYVPGKLYLAGPFAGAPLSVVSIVPAVAGPFDVGTVVTHLALQIDPRTAQVRVDGAASDPIPHILAGIPLKVRDIRAYVDRPDFTLNPTSCNPFEVGARLWGGGREVFSSADDFPVAVAERFQAANCQRLGFKPRLSLRLNGGHRRGANPALRGVFRPRPGDANLANLALRLSRSSFLDQGHIRTICTRVQFAAEACPKGAIYGRARAFTPLLEDPLEGPVYLRSSSNELPDFVADLQGIVDVEAVARIDSVRGGIRASFEDVPDAPLEKVVVRMQGGRKGLIVNSTDLCRGRNRANARMRGHNGMAHGTRPVVRVRCGKKGKGRRQGRGAP